MPQASLRALHATTLGSERLPLPATTPSFPTTASSTATVTRHTPMTALALIRACMHSLPPASESAHPNLPCWTVLLKHLSSVLAM
jgi:hypothetical protein